MEITRREMKTFWGIKGFEMVTDDETFNCGNETFYRTKAIFIPPQATQSEAERALGYASRFLDKGVPSYLIKE